MSPDDEIRIRFQEAHETLFGFKPRTQYTVNQMIAWLDARDVKADQRARMERDITWLERNGVGSFNQFVQSRVQVMLNEVSTRK